MTATIRPKHRYNAETVLDWILAEIPDRGRCLDILAEAVAAAEEYGVRKALHRLGPIIADAEVARAALAEEVDL